MRCLVTGGAGFIGSHLVERLVKDEHDVLVFDNLSTGTLDNIKGFLDVLHAGHFVQADVRDPLACSRAMHDIDVVFHLAARGSVPRSVDDPIGSNEVNVTGTLNLLAAAQKAGVKRFVYSSSSSVYGPQEHAEKSEGLVPNPSSPYGVSKLAAERYCAAFWHTHGLETASLRYFNVYGPRQNPDGQYAAVIPRFIKAALAGKRPTIYGNGGQTRDFTYVSDVVEANILVAKELSYGEAINIGSGNSTSIFDLAKTIVGWPGMPAATLGPDGSPYEFVPERLGDVTHSRALLMLAWEHLGYKPKVTLEEGLKKTLAWHRENR